MYSDVKYVRIVNGVFGSKCEEGKDHNEKVNGINCAIHLIERNMEIDLSYINAYNIIVNKDICDVMYLLNVIVDLLSVLKKDSKEECEEDEDVNENDNSEDIIIKDKALTEIEDEGEYSFVKTKLLTEANNVMTKSKTKHKHKQTSNNSNINFSNNNNNTGDLLYSHIPNHQRSTVDNNNNSNKPDNINNHNNYNNNHSNSNSTSNNEDSSSQNETQLPCFMYFPLSKQDLLKEINSITKQIFSPSEYSTLSNNLTFSKSLSSLTSIISSYFSSITNLPPTAITREFIHTNISEVEIIIKQFFLPQSIDHRCNPYMQAASILINNPYFIEQLSHKRSTLLSTHLQLKRNNYLTTQQAADTQLIQMNNDFISTLSMKQDYIYDKLRLQESVNTFNKSKNIYKVNLLEKNLKQIKADLLTQEQFNKYKRVKLGSNHTNNIKNKHL